MGQYLHGPTMRVCKSLEEYKAVCKVWERRHNKLYRNPVTSYASERAKREAEIVRLTAIKIDRKLALKKLIQPLEKKREIWAKKRDEAVGLKIKEQQQLLNDAIAQVEKYKLQVKLLRGAVNNFEKEGRKEWEKSNPFKEEKQLASLRQKLYKI